ncbi:MAG: hypothetical protein ACTHN5_17075 [Phycisphaerae bacterium]
MTRILALPIALLAPLFLASLAHADVITYDVTGYIDTSDYLRISGSSFQWVHTDTGGAAVGRHAGNNFPTIISSTLNGVPQLSNVNWIPTWPQPVPNEIRFNALSSSLDTIAPPLPASVADVQLSVLSGRGSLLLTALPSPQNNNTLIIEFKDGFSGSANLDALITITTPEPASLSLLALASLPLLLKRARNSSPSF